MSDVFENVGKQLKGSRVVIWVFFASLAMLIIGGNHFWEDTLSSRYGLEMLEKYLGLVPASYEFTYWTMSLAPQIAQIVFGFMYLKDTNKNKWALTAASLSFFIDFFADVWYRSAEGLFSSVQVFAATFIITFVFFTIGSEVFVTVGFSLVMELFPDFVEQMRRLNSDVRKAFQKSVDRQDQSQKNNNNQQQHGGKQPHNLPPIKRPIPRP